MFYIFSHKPADKEFISDFLVGGFVAIIVVPFYIIRL